MKKLALLCALLSSLSWQLVLPISLGSTVANKKTRRLGLFLTRDIELLKSCPTLALLAPNKGGLEVSKKMQYVSVAQWAAKLQHVKLGVIFHKV